MIVRINGKIVDFVNEKKSEINTIGTPNMELPDLSWSDLIEQTDQAKEFLDFSSPVTYLPSVNEIDMMNYHWLSKFEATEFMYRFSKWSVSEVLTAFGVM